MSSVRPKEDAIRAFAKASKDKPFVMVNLLKFNKDGGEAEYAEYSLGAMKKVQEAGGRLVFAGRVEHFLVGESGWDMVALVEYPSRNAFLKMVTDPEYLKIHEHRERSLERAELFAVAPGQPPAGGTR